MRKQGQRQRTSWRKNQETSEQKNRNRKKKKQPKSNERIMEFKEENGKSDKEKTEKVVE